MTTALTIFQGRAGDHNDLAMPGAKSLGEHLSKLVDAKAVSGPAGLWDSGLGAGVGLEDIVLLGQRDLDPFEVDLIQSGKVRHIPPGPGLEGKLRMAIAGRSVYVHLDCDVLEPGIVPTDYVHPDGLTLEDLRSACEVNAETEILGLEIAEFQNAWVVDGPPVSPGPLIQSLTPLLRKFGQPA